MRALRHRLVSLFLILLAGVALHAAEAPAGEKLPVAGLISSWFPYSHPDLMLGRIVKTYSLDGKGESSRMRLASLYVDRPQQGDFSGKIAAEYNVRLSKGVEDALTLGTGKLAVGGVLIVDVWADYPMSKTGQMIYPHRAMFDEVVKVFRASGKVAPVFIDIYLADNWTDAWHIYSTCKEMGIPLMAGSSVPVGWRKPAAEVKRGAKLKEVVGISYHTTHLYGFHGLEMIQTLAERREGGETGVASVQTLTGQAVWDAAGKEYDPELLADVLARHEPPLTLEGVKQSVKEPVMFIVKYQDGLRAELFTLNNAVQHWAAGWRYADDSKESTLFWLDEEQSMLHFSVQMQGIERFILTGTPSWPVERTLLTSGMLHAAHVSLTENGRLVETPEMGKIRYQGNWEWTPLPFPNGK
ncbi:MAG: hypothetical protein ACYDCO_25735 [Armatimonadota bacterium]